MADPIALALLLAYLGLFAFGTRRAARLSGGRVWLFGQARGRDRLAALGFRLGFGLAVLGTLAVLLIPALQPVLTLWRPGGLAVPGLILGLAGATLALAAQHRMGASWRVGVAWGQEGALVTCGLFRLSRNPTFLGQALLLGGVLLAVPTAPAASGLILFLIAARMQIRQEERVMAAAHGAAWRAWAARVPRWIGPASLQALWPPRRDT